MPPAHTVVNGGREIAGVAESVAVAVAVVAVAQMKEQGGGVEAGYKLRSIK